MAMASDRAAAADGPRVTIYHVAGSGTPYARPYLGTSPVTGKPIRPYKEFPGMTDEEALDAAREWVEDLTHTYRDGYSRSVSDMLCRYVDQMESAQHSANTVRTYRLYARRYAGPIGKVRVEDVTPETLDELFGRLMDTGPDGGGPLSARTVRGFRDFLAGAFERFRSYGLCATNPVRDTLRPGGDGPEAASLDEDEVAALAATLAKAMAATDTDRRSAGRRCAAFAAYLALYTGMRRGEVMGLRRSDVRKATSELLVSGTVVEDDGRVFRQNKTKGRRVRVIALAPHTMGAVGAHMDWERGVCRLRRDSPLITVDGGWLRPSYVAERFRSLRAEAGLDGSVTLHTLRHTHATWLLEGGANMLDVQERLGHAYVSTTLETYGHVMPGRDGRVAALFERRVADVRDDSETDEREDQGDGER